MNNKSTGEIITFYSYKGGTGRSMALANTACLLAQRQDAVEGVLMIDWDLEAPGLHQFFHGRFENSRDELGNLPSGQLGLIDLFYEIKNRLEKSESQDNIPEDVFSEIDIQKYIVKLNRPSLFLMPAGKFDDGLYSTRVNEFEWADFFSHFPSVITQFAQHLREKFKYVLIDSRTGYTDTSGICTSIMPEKLVTVFTPNRQSVSGVVELIRRATDYRKQSDDLRPLMIFPLPSRIENAESILKKDWRFGNSQGVAGYQNQLESVLIDVYSLQECDLTNYFDEYQLQYAPRYSYGEELAVLSERSEDRLSLARSFENFAERIISFENPWEVTKNSLPAYEVESNKYKDIHQSTVDRQPATIENIFQPNWFRALVIISLFVVAGALIISASAIQKLVLATQSPTSTSTEMIETPNLVVTNTLTDTPIPPTPELGKDFTSADYGKLIYQENFDNAVGWELGNSRLENGNLIMAPNSAVYPFIFGGERTSYADYIFESRFSNPEGAQSFSYYLRYQNTQCSNCSIQIAIDFYSREIVGRVVTGASFYKDISVVGIPIDPAQWNKIDIKVEGSNYKVYINNSFVMSFTDHTYESGSFVIDTVGPKGIEIDYIRIYDLPSLPTATPTP